MSTLFQTEEAFQELLALLAGTTSGRWRLVAISRFLGRIEGQEAEHEVYLVELAQHLPVLMEHFDPVGLTPEVLRTCSLQWTSAREACPLLGEIEGFEEALCRLRAATALLYAYAGDVVSAYEVAVAPGEEPPVGLEELAQDQVDPLKRLERAVEQLAVEGLPGAQALGQVRDVWQAQRRTGRSGVAVPVVERPADEEAGDPFEVGALRTLHVEIFGERAESDDLLTEIRVYGAEEATGHLLERPVRAARHLLARTHPRLAERYAVGRVRFGRGRLLHAGHSADLALGATFYSALLWFFEERRQVRPAPGVVLTGRLDAEGAVLPVEGLAVKMQTAFFSWAQVVAVPEAQKAEAQSILRRWSAAYPGRSLEVVGVSHLREVFYDRRLTDEETASWVRHAARRAWRRKFRIAAVGVIIVLLLTVGRLLYGPMDKNPVAGEVVGELLHLKNAAGQTVGKIRFARSSPGLSQMMENRGEQWFSLVDINGDGTNEVIWTRLAPDDLPRSVALVCTSPTGDQTYWERPIDFPLGFPGRPEVTSKDGFLVWGLTAGDLDRDGAPEVIALITHRHYFPGFVARYDARSGRRQGYYQHAGWLMSMNEVDLDGDGTEEIVAGGTNNAYDGQAVVVALDPRHLSGHGPAEGVYRPETYRPGTELAYVRMPRTEIGRFYRLDKSHARARVSPRSTHFTREITVRYDEAVNAEVARSVKHSRPQLLMKLGYDLVPRSVVATPRYEALSRRLYEDGKISSPVTPAFLQDFMDGFLYWDGETWQHEPDITRPNGTQQEVQTAGD